MVTQDDLIPWADIQSGKRKFECRGAVIYGNAMAAADPRSETRLELLHIGPFGRDPRGINTRVEERPFIAVEQRRIDRNQVPAPRIWISPDWAAAKRTRSSCPR